MYKIRTLYFVWFKIFVFFVDGEGNYNSQNPKVYIPTFSSLDVKPLKGECMK